jgi:predicted ATPase
MLKSISTENFKVFKSKITFPLSKINLLTGINGRGKSTLLQSMLLLRQSFTNEPIPDGLLLNGNCVNLGTFDDIRNTAISKQISFSYNFNDGSEASIIVGEDSLDSMVAKILSGSIQKLNNFQHTHYIAADRVGPQEYYIKSTLPKFLNVGTRGEFIGNVLLQKKTDLVNEILCIKERDFEGHMRQISQELETQVGEWLSKILDTDNTKVEAKDVGNRVVIVSFKFGNNSKEYKPNNVGFGYSYILPIVVSCLIAKESEYLIIENPEAHLHPKAQFGLIELITKVAQCGVQVFIESHSEHILNALRVSISKKENSIKNSDVSVLFFQNNEDRPAVSINIDSDGGIDHWPSDFFDQTENALKQILGFKL